MWRVCGDVFFFYLHLAKCVLGRSLVLHNREQDKSFQKEGGLYNSNSQHVKDFHALCSNLVLTSKLLHGPKKLLTSPHSLLYQLVECGFGGDLVCHAHLGPVPEGVCHSRGAAERPVLPIPCRGSRRRVWLQHRKRPVCDHWGWQSAPWTSVPLCRARWQREVAAEILQSHLPV